MFQLKIHPQHSWRAQLKIHKAPVNAVSQKDLDDFEKLLLELESTYPKLRLLVVQAHVLSPKGKHIFSAGADLKERETWSEEHWLAHVRRQRALLWRFKTLPQQVLCLVSGLALGLGAELCAASDEVWALPRATFAFPEKKYEILPGAGGYAWAKYFSKMPRLALEAIEKAEPFDREHAQKLGLVSLCLENEADLDSALEKLALLCQTRDPEEERKNKIQKLQLEKLRLAFEEEDIAYTKALKRRFELKLKNTSDKIL